MNIKLLYSALLIFISTTCFAQDPIQVDLELSTTTDKFQLVVHTDSTDLPDSLTVKGKIIEHYKGICGDLCAGGTIKIELDKKVEGYPHWYVYAITACYNGDVIKENITINLSKYTGLEEDCFYKYAVDIIDSRGIPYYKLSEKESEKIAK